MAPRLTVGIQKEISRPSPASIRRGRKGMATLSRKIHYIGSEHGRENCKLMDQEGRELVPQQAIDQMGGKGAKYVEAVTDLSRTEVEALAARHPGRDREEVVDEFFRRQMSSLDPSGKGVLARHGEADGSYHAHLLLPGDREYPRLEGPHAALQKAFDVAWREDQDRRIRDWTAFAEIAPATKNVRTLRDQERGLRAEKKKVAAMRDPGDRILARENLAVKSANLEIERHEAELARLDAVWRSRGQRDGLEHQVDREKEEHRHTREVRQIEGERLGLARHQARKLDAHDVKSAWTRAKVDLLWGGPENRESFKHLSAPERREVREAALRRELEVLRRKHELELQDPLVDREKRLERHTAENQAVLLSFEAACLRDREYALGGGLSKNILTAGRRQELMSTRHELERQALHAQAASTGKSASPGAMEKLTQRQTKERVALGSGITSNAGTKLASKAQSKLKTGARRVIQAPTKALKKLAKAHEKATGRGGNHALKKDLDRVESSAHGLLTAAGSAAAKTALTAVTETTKGLSHQTKHIAEAAQVTARAVATGLVSPAAAAKEAASGYAKVGGEAAKTAAKDLADGTKKTAREAGEGAKETLGQGLQSIASFGVGAMPQEIQAAVGVLKEGTKATVQTVASLVRLDLVGAATGAGKGALQVAGEATKGLKGELGIVGKPLDLASKIPVIGLIPSLAKHAAELSLGAGSVAGKAQSVDLEL